MATNPRIARISFAVAQALRAEPKVPKDHMVIPPELHNQPKMFSFFTQYGC
jgi:hypothetical protein